LCPTPIRVGASLKSVDLTTVLDEGRWSGYQKLLISGTALAIKIPKR
jgi:hypothetical protein